MSLAASSASIQSNYSEYSEQNSNYDDDDIDMDNIDGLDDGDAMEAEAKESNYVCLTPDDIVREQQEEIQKIAELFEVSGPIARQLLTHMKWNSDRLIERYYDGEAERIFKEAGIVNPHATHRSEKRNVYALTDGGRSSVSGIVATVFGSTGFLGRYVVNNFGRMGSQVFVPYRGEEHATNHLRVMGDVGQVVAVKYNILDKESIRQAMKNSNVVINLASQWWPSRNFNPHAVNVVGARNIAEVAAEMGIDRFVHFSSTAASLQSDSEYWRTKAEGELAVKKAFPEVTIMKPTIVTGMEDKWLNSHGSMIHYWPVYPVWEKNRRYQPIMAESVAEAVVAAVTNPESVGQTYELGGPKVYTMAELMDLMLIVTRHKPTMINLPLGAMKLFAKLTAWHRNPRFTEDLLEDTTDRVVSDDPNVKTLEDLGVKHKYLEDYIQMIMRRYKKQIRFEEIVVLPNEGVEKHK